MKMHRFLALAAILAGTILAGPILTGSSRPAAAEASPTWRDTGVRLADLRRPLCVDPTQPHVALIPDEDRGTLAVDWQTGSTRVLDPRPFDVCASSGWIYASDNLGRGPFYRFRLSAPAAQPIAHPPDFVAEDGSQYVYSLSAYTSLPHRQLWASADGGLTWTERGQQFGGRIEQLALATADARVLYALVLNETPPPPGQALAGVYASTDAGATWELRSRTPVAVGRQGGDTRLYLTTVAGAHAPADLVELVSDTPASPTSHHEEILLSGDGGRSFVPAGVTDDVLGLQFVYTHEGILRLTQHVGGGGDFVLQGQSLDLSTDSGRTWQPLPPPPTPAANPTPHPDRLEVAPAAPANVFLSNFETANAPLKYSPDGGHTWQAFPKRTDWWYFFSPYLPLSVLGVQASESSAPPVSAGPGTPEPAQTPLPGSALRNHLFVLDLPAAGTHQPAPAPASDAPGALYFPATGHNLAAPFRAYWEAHGGLAQFGYPRTAAFPEVSSTDGRVYLTQYFERNRFEYHPEFAGTPYEVELGLLGSEQTAARRVAGEGAFNHFADAHYPGGIYFPATGHNLRNSFLAYWQAHGGLAIYGYPISEEFEEVSPTDGRRYVVQYFERNRFEWHPENRGTPSEVLLGLLGNTLLAAKGWR